MCCLLPSPGNGSVWSKPCCPAEGSELDSSVTSNLVLSAGMVPGSRRVASLPKTPLLLHHLRSFAIPLLFIRRAQRGPVLNLQLPAPKRGMFFFPGAAKVHWMQQMFWCQVPTP